MATVYGGYDTSAGYEAYRAVLDYSTSQTNTDWTVSLTGKVQSGYGSDSLSNFALSLTIGDSTTSKSSSSYMSAGSTVEFGTKSRTYSRGHSAVNCLISAYAKNDGTYTGWSGSSTASAIITIPAKPSYSVTYNANGGSGAPSSQTKWYNETLTLSSAKPTRSGYSFKGWATSSSSTTVAYSSGAQYSQNAALTLYAVWDTATYTITYDKNGGSSQPSQQTKTHGTALTLRAGITHANTTTSYTVSFSANYSGGTNPSNLTATKTTTYSFKTYGWKATDGTTYAGGGSYTKNASTTMTAQWDTSSSTTSVTLPSPTRSGYSFGGWYKESACTTKIANGGASYTPSSSITLYAKWSTATYTITYYANGGSGAPASQTKTHGTNITLSSTKPTRTGYTFQGWGTSSSATTVSYAAGATYSSNQNLNLYAVWQAITYTVTPNANGGTLKSGCNALTKTYGVNLTLWASSLNPTRTGYSFQGWGTSASASSATYQAGGNYTANSAATLYAVWAVSYISPKVKKVTAIRCDNTGAPQDDGTYCKVTVTFQAGSNPVTGVTVQVGEVSAAATLSESTAVKVLGEFSPNAKFSVIATVTDGTSTATMRTLLTAAKFPIDVLARGLGVAIGVAATMANRFEVAWATIFSDVSAAIRASTVDRDGTAPNENTYTNQFRIEDKDADALGYVDGYQLSTGETGIRLVAFAGPSGNAVYNVFRIGKRADGTNAYHITDPAAFRIASNVASVTNQSEQNVNFGEGSGTTDFTVYANVTNSSSPDYGDRVGLWAKPDGIALYNSTDSSYDWNLTLPVSVENGGSGRSTVYKNTTVSSVITAASGRTISSVTYAEWGKVAQLSVSVSGFSSSTGTQTVGTVVEGRRPVYAVYATAITSANAPYATLAADGTMSVYWSNAPGTSTGYTIRFIYLLA